MLTLSVDTCLNACTAVVGQDGRVVAAISEPMVRGHQERLAPMVAEVMGEARIGFPDLVRIGATVGPGSFTGLRIGLSFARASALALDIPCVGFSSLEALASGLPGRVIAIADARRGQAYWQAFENGAAAGEPLASTIEEAAAYFSGADALAVGPGAPLLEGRGFGLLPLNGPEAGALAALTAMRPPGAVAPLYLRGADARLPGGREP